MTSILWLAFFSIIHFTAAGNICRTDCEVQFVPKGCYKDNGRNRALPNYIYNERDPRAKKTYGGRRIDWYNWNEYYPGFACRCAEKAKAQGYDLFGVQFYGECWAGHSGKNNYLQYGEDMKGCIEDSFLTCTPYSRYCVGKQWRNMVYQIVDATCPKINFERVGCFGDKHQPFARPLPDYLFNDRDPSIDNFSGRRIEWRAWDIYLPEFACRCAEAAKKANHTFFGVQFYGECWSGLNGHMTYDIDGPRQGGCINPCYQPCAQHNKFCAGRNFENFVYRIVDGSCEVDISPVGCYKEDSAIPAMGEIFHNEAAPDKPNFVGNMIQSVDNYEAYFPDFLCKCARKARENGWEYFGVRELGICVRGNPPSNYARHGPSQQCFVGNSSIACPNGSKLCSGLNSEANYVYKVTLPGETPVRDVAQDIPDEPPKVNIPPPIFMRSQRHPKAKARLYGKRLL